MAEILELVSQSYSRSCEFESHTDTMVDRTPKSIVPFTSNYYGLIGVHQGERRGGSDGERAGYRERGGIWRQIERGRERGGRKGERWGRERDGGGREGGREMKSY